MWGGWGFYSPNHQMWPLLGALCSMAHRTVRCTPDSPVPPATSSLPLDSDRWSSDMWPRLEVRCTPDSPVNFSGAAAARTRGWRVPEAAVRWRTGHVRCTPDSPVNYSAPASANSRGRRVEVEVLWRRVENEVLWRRVENEVYGRTGHCPV